MSKKLLILGAGQYGIQAKEIAQAMGGFDRIEFLDDGSELAVAPLEAIEKIEYDEAFVAIGNPVLRERYYEKIRKPVTLIHPRAAVSRSATVGEGSILEAGAVVSAGARIGRGTIVMANAVVGHNATVGDFCQLKYNCSISENCNLPDRTKVDCNVVFGGVGARKIDFEPDDGKKAEAEQQKKEMVRK